MSDSVGITFNQVRVQRRSQVILDIDLRIEPGACVGIMGSNGAGKTTLLKATLNLIKPTQGFVTLGESVWPTLSWWQHARVRRQIGYIPQRTTYHEELPFTVHEVVAMGCAPAKGLFRRLDAEDALRIDHWMDRLGLGERKTQPFRSLSGGEQQKVLIARAMVQNPRMLILDEPCANLDFGWKCRITEWIERLYAQTGMTVLMVCHEMSLVPACCTHLLLMHEGRILAYDQPDRVLDHADLAEIYGCAIERVQVKGRTCVVGYQWEGECG